MTGIRIAKHEDLEAIRADFPDTSSFATKTEVNGKADSNHVHSYNDLTEKPTIPSAPDLSGYATTSALTTELANKSDTGHAHAYSEITGTPTIPADTSSEVAALRSELDALKLVVDGLVNPPEEPIE